MTFQDDLATMQTVVWGYFGVPATWNGVDCLVIRDAPDAEIRFGTSRAVVGTVMMDVRQIEVALAAEGDVVVLNPLTSPQTFIIIGEPLGDSQRTSWSCQAKPG